MPKINILFFLVYLLLIFWSLFPNHFLVANDLHHISGSVYKSNFSLPYSWKEGEAIGLGEYAVPTLWNWPVNLIFGLFAHLNIPFQISLYVLGVVPIVIFSVIGIIKLGKYYKISLSNAVVGAALYLSNSYILILIDGGQLNLALAYSLIPFAFYSFRKSVENGIKHRIFLFLSSVLLISFFDLRVLYLLFIIITFDFAFEVIYSRKFLKALMTYLSIGLISAITLAGIHAYWIIPALFVKSISLPLNYDNPEQLSFLSFSTLGHSLLLLSPHWYKNIFGDITKLRLEFILFPAISWLALLFYKKNRWVGFWGVIALIGVFLSKGANNPGGEIYQWLFVNIPGFSLFRDPTKFYFLTALSYALLFSFTLEKVSFWLGKKTKRFVILLPLIPLLYFSILNYPIYFGLMNGLFSKPSMVSDFLTFEKVLKSDNNFGRVFWIPTKSPLGYNDKDHPALEATRLSQLRPFVMGTKGTYETFNFLREADYMGEIFDIVGIKYIAYPYLDTKSRRFGFDDINYYYLFQNQIKSLSWIDTQVNDSLVPLLKTKTNQDRFFITPNLWFVVGADDIYKKSLKDEIPLSQNSLVFMEEKAGVVEDIKKYPEAKIVLNRKNLLDFALTFTKDEDLLAPAESLKTDPDQSGWWKRDPSDLLGWKSFLKSKYDLDYADFDYQKGWAVAEGDLELTIKTPILEQEKLLFARLMESSRSGTVAFSSADEQIGQVSTKTFVDDQPNLRWFEIGKVKKGSSSIRIQTTGDINVVNTLAIIDPDKWLSYQEYAKDYQEGGRISNFVKLASNTDVKVGYERVNPTKYKVTISGLTNPAYLVFSESYDKLWKLDGVSPLPGYSILNVYRVEKNGIYNIEYESQQYVYIGLGITFLFISFIIVVYLYNKRLVHD